MKRQASPTTNNRKEEARRNFLRAYEQRRARETLMNLENSPRFANAPLSPVRAGILADIRRDAGVAEDVIRERARAPSIWEERARATRARRRHGP